MATSTASLGTVAGFLPVAGASSQHGSLKLVRSLH
jgi:hypothetical protein